MGRLRNRGCWYRGTKEPAPPTSAGPSPLPKCLVQKKKVVTTCICWGEGDGLFGAPCLPFAVPSRPLAAGMEARGAKGAPRTKGSSALLPPASHQRPSLGRPAASPGCRSACRGLPRPCRTDTSRAAVTCAAAAQTQTHPQPPGGRARPAAAAFPLWAAPCRPSLLAAKLCLVISINYWYLNRFSSLR